MIFGCLGRVPTTLQWTIPPDPPGISITFFQIDDLTTTPVTYPEVIAFTGIEAKPGSKENWTSYFLKVSLALHKKVGRAYKEQPSKCCSFGGETGEMEDEMLTKRIGDQVDSTEGCIAQRTFAFTG